MRRCAQDLKTRLRSRLPQLFPAALILRAWYDLVVETAARLSGGGS